MRPRFPPTSPEHPQESWQQETEPLLWDRNGSFLRQRLEQASPDHGFWTRWLLWLVSLRRLASVPGGGSGQLLSANTRLLFYRYEISVLSQAAITLATVSPMKLSAISL